MKVLYITQPGILRPWYDDFTAAIDGKHEIVMFDPAQPHAAQFQGKVSGRSLKLAANRRHMS